MEINPEAEASFVESFSNVQHAVHINAVEKMFWDRHVMQSVPPTIPTKIALVMSELGEAVEADRMDNREGLEEELADVIIRVMDIAGFLRINLASRIVEKHRINRGRPELHNKKY